MTTQPDVATALAAYEVAVRITYGDFVKKKYADAVIAAQQERIRELEAAENSALAVLKELLEEEFYSWNGSHEYAQCNYCYADLHGGELHQSDCKVLKWQALVAAAAQADDSEGDAG